MTIDINALRRLAQEATPGPWKMLPVGDGRQKFAVADSEFLSILTVTDEGDATFGTVYDDADAAFIAAANPAAISDLLDRLEAAESDGMEQARLNGMGSEREAALLSKLEAAEKERDDLRADKKALEREAVRLVEQADSVAADLVSAWKERDALRAKIEQMERQEPVAWMRDQWSPDCGNFWELHRDDEMGWRDRKDWVPLYTLPVAQPAPNALDGWREAAVAWEVCASVHREYARRKDPFFNTRQGDFVKHAQYARVMLAAAPKPEGE